MFSLIAYFFVCLPDPIGVPDGFVHKIHDQETLEKWLERQRMHEDDTEEVHEIREDKILVSLRFWQTEAEDSHLHRVTPLFRVAQKAFPDIPKAEEESTSTLTTPRTIVEMAVPLFDDKQEEISKAFDLGLTLVRDFQRSYHRVRRRPLRLVTRQNLPFMIPYGIRRVGTDFDEWPDQLSLMLLHMNLHVDARDSDMDGSELRLLGEATEMRVGERVFASYLDLRREAMVSLYRDGNTRTGVLFTAMAAELLLDDLLAHMMWEDGIRPEHAASIFDDKSIGDRVRQEYHWRLGGSGWGLDRSAPQLEWQNRVAAVRHRVVHAGYEPGYEEAVSALEALSALEGLISARLASSRGLTKYPRTACMFLGEPGLRQRGAWNQKIAALAEDPSEPFWPATFFRWKRAMQRSRRERPPDARDPEEAEALTVALVYADGDVVWVLHDRGAAMACRAAWPNNLSRPQEQELERLRESATEETGPISVLFPGVDAAKETGSRWIPEYRLVPLAGVMVDGKDLDPRL